jgi:hypothetical protein
MVATWSLDTRPHKKGDDASDWHSWIVRSGNPRTHCAIQFGSSGIDQDEAEQLVLAMIGGLNEHERQRGSS